LDNVIVNTIDEFEDITYRYLLKEFKLVQDSDNQRLLNKQKKGKVSIHIFLYVLGWILVYFINMLSYGAFGYYIYYTPNPMMLILMLFALFGIFNILYYIYCRLHKEVVLIQVQKATKTGIKANSLNENNFCVECGSSIKETDKVCPKCGKLIQK